ncbi:hypothetical protein [Aquabacterium sp. J223]|uniref:hypothetical protein n=1 Tax=Aquabacterium sp. J223 TaxID=2898431 RepID=UPI0021AD6386|nr:hypothetical protein [Aquabacterium sp. J223]UUX95547.1 hypothetical protein LRS07_20475 [Aquabacterium sp. J223]
MWLPQWLYERLPALYAVLGAWCLWLSGRSSIALMSAALLFSAAGLVHWWRRDARAEAKPARRAARTPRRAAR